MARLHNYRIRFLDRDGVPFDSRDITAESIVGATKQAAEISTEGPRSNVLYCVVGFCMDGVREQVHPR